MAFVRSWKYTEPEPLYDRYTTRHWSKYLINRLPDPENKGEFFYMSEGFTLYSVRNWTSSSGYFTGKSSHRNIQELARRPVGIPHELEATHGTGMEQYKSRNTHILSRRVPRENNNLR